MKTDEWNAKRLFNEWKRQNHLKSKSSSNHEASLAHTMHIAKEMERFSNLRKNPNSEKSELQACPFQNVDTDTTTEPLDLSRKHKWTPGFRSTPEKDPKNQKTKSLVKDDASQAHNIYVAKEKERQYKMRLQRLHKFIRNQMTERDEKAEKERSIQIFKGLQKTAVFLNYDLRCVSKNIFIRNITKFLKLFLIIKHPFGPNW